MTTAGGRAIVLAVDVGEESALQRMVDTTIAEYGRIDVLYNNALLVSTDLAMRDMDILKFDPEVFYATMRVNVVGGVTARSEEHTSELQSLMRISYAVFCLKKKNTIIIILIYNYNHN